VRGSISRRGDSWRVHVYLGLDSQTGKQRYLTRTVHGTKRDAERVSTDLSPRRTVAASVTPRR